MGGKRKVDGEGSGVVVTTAALRTEEAEPQQCSAQCYGAAPFRVSENFGLDGREKTCKILEHSVVRLCRLGESNHQTDGIGIGWRCCAKEQSLVGIMRCLNA
ncbi:MAG: hypothetical protein DRP63_09160 [Planctomycetota bacterium]|nr:MAG: hypothetical protein DRP63_09160 [Planctomycetota bacterium]